MFFACGLENTTVVVDEKSIDNELADEILNIQNKTITEVDTNDFEMTIINAIFKEGLEDNIALVGDRPQGKGRVTTFVKILENPLLNALEIEGIGENRKCFMEILLAKKKQRNFWCLLALYFENEIFSDEKEYHHTLSNDFVLLYGNGGVKNDTIGEFNLSYLNGSFYQNLLTMRIQNVRYHLTENDAFFELHVGGVSTGESYQSLDIYSIKKMSKIFQNPTSHYSNELLCEADTSRLCFGWDTTVEYSDECLKFHKNGKNEFGNIIDGTKTWCPSD